MHHLGAGTVKSGGGDSFADGDDVVTIFEKILGFLKFCSPCNGAGAVWGILPSMEKMLGFVRFFN